MRPQPWIPVLLVLALVACLLPEQASSSTKAFSGIETTLPRRLPQYTEKLFASVRPAVVQLRSLNPTTYELGVGTAFFISTSGELLTAYHVVERGKLFEIRTLSGKSLRAQLITYDEQADIALLKVQGKGPFPALKVATKSPRVGEVIFAIGNSHGDFLQPRRGQLLRLDAKVNQVDFPQQTLEMDAELSPGDSGGPIIDQNGKAIGIVSYIKVDDSNRTRASYAVPLTEDNELLNSLRAKQQ